MTWARIDDAFSAHRKFLRAGPEGVTLFVAGLCYCARHATDGRIEKDELAEVYPWSNLKAKRVAARLVEVGFWEDHGSFWMVHDYLEYNEARDEILSKKAANADRQRKFRERRRAREERKPEEVTRDQRVTHALRNAESNGGVDPGQGAGTDHVDAPDEVTRDQRAPVPSRPVSSRDLSSKDPTPRARESLPIVPDDVPGFAPAEWTKVLALFEDEYEQRYQTRLGLHSGQRDRAMSVHAWAVAEAKRRGVPWEDCVREAVRAALQDPFVGKARNPWAVFAASPGGWAKEAAAGDRDRALVRRKTILAKADAALKRGDMDGYARLTEEANALGC